MSRSGRIGRHFFVRAFPFWVAVVGIASVATVSVLVGRTPVEQATMAGAGMELLGLIAVAVGLSKLRRQFGRPSLADSVGAWFRELPSVFKKQDTRIITGTANLSVKVHGSMTATVRPGPNSTIDRRVELLEKAVEQLRDDQRRQFDQHERTLAKLTTDLTTEQRDREQAVEKLRGTVEDLAVGGLHFEFVGVVWLFLGIFLGTLPDQSVAIIRWVLCLIG